MKKIISIASLLLAAALSAQTQAAANPAAPKKAEQAPAASATTKNNAQAPSANQAAQKNAAQAPANTEAQKMAEQTPAAPQTQPKRDAFAAMLYVSIQDPSMEWWFNVPANAAPHISELKKIFFNQEFSLFPFANNAKVKDGKFEMSYTITMESPDGKSTDLVRDAKFDGTKVSDDIIVACPDVIDFKLDRRFPEGLYKFKMSAKDKISGETSEYENHIRLTEWSVPATFADKKLVAEYVRAYSLQPSPEILYSIVFSNDFDLEQKGAPNSLNYTYLGFIKAAFKKNMFLISQIRDGFKSMSDINRAKFILILALLDAEAVDDSQLTEVEKQYQKKIRTFKMPNPYGKWDPFLGAAQIDMLWGEFFANGTYRPIRRILNILSHAKDAAFADGLAEKRQAPKTREEWDKYMFGRLYKAALKTVAINASRYPLVEQYCAWALHHGDIPKVSYEVLSPLLEHIREMKSPEGAEGGKDELPKVKMPEIDINKI